MASSADVSDLTLAAEVSDLPAEVTNAINRLQKYATAATSSVVVLSELEKKLAVLHRRVQMARQEHLDVQRFQDLQRVERSPPQFLNKLKQIMSASTFPLHSVYFRGPTQ